jgi:hypothetical protein
MTSFNGMPVVVSPWVPLKPRIQLPGGSPISDEFRAEFNRWLLDRFGADEQVLIINRSLVMLPSTFERLRRLYK